MNEPKLKIERVLNMEALERLKDDWNALLLQSESKAVELTHEWQTTYWKYFNKGAELFVLLVKQADSIVAIAPLKLTHVRLLGAIKSRRLELIAAAESNYQDLIIGDNSEAVLKCILDYLIGIQVSWDVLSLRRIPECSTAILYLQKKLGEFTFRQIARQERCVFLQLDYPNATEFTEYRRKKRRSNKRGIIKNKAERELGEIRLIHCSTAEQFRSRLLEFFELHRKRWSQTDTPSQFNNDRNCKFYLEIMPQLLSKKQIDLCVLEAGGTQLAQILNFTFEKVCVGQLIAYDIAYARYSPVKILFDIFIEESISKGIEIIDFGLYYPYKEHWTNREKNRVDLEIYPNRFLPKCIYVVNLGYGSLLMRLRSSPRLLNIAKYARARIRSLVQRSNR